MLSSQVAKKDNLITKQKENIDKISYSNDAQRKRTERTTSRITDDYEKAKQSN